jgi:hypothetical protein
MRKLLLFITFVLSIGLFGCSKVSSTSNSKDYVSPNGVMKGDDVELKVYSINPSAFIDSLGFMVTPRVYITYNQSSTIYDRNLIYVVNNSTNPVFKKFTATQDNQNIGLGADVLYISSKVMLQIVVNGKVIKEGYVDNTIKSCSISLDKS